MASRRAPMPGRPCVHRGRHHRAARRARTGQLALRERTDVRAGQHLPVGKPTSQPATDAGWSPSAPRTPPRVTGARAAVPRPAVPGDWRPSLGRDPDWTAGRAARVVPACGLRCGGAVVEAARPGHGPLPAAVPLPVPASTRAVTPVVEPPALTAADAIDWTYLRPDGDRPARCGPRPGRGSPPGWPATPGPSPSKRLDASPGPAPRRPTCRSAQTASRPRPWPARR